jgi:hypothetical protein
VRLAIAATLLLGALASGGCGSGAEAEPSVDLDAIAEGLRQDLKLAADDGLDAPASVDCIEPEGGPVECIAYYQVADDVALIAEYRLRPAPERDPEIDAEYGPFYIGRLVDAHEQLDVPERAYDVTEVEL